MIALKLWDWFCKIGEPRVECSGKAGETALPTKQVSEQVSRSGVDTMCSRICGHESCQCGGTIRGLHCVWSYYRLGQEKNNKKIIKN